MQPLIDFGSLQKLMERGLVTGKWSVNQFNSRDYWSEIPTSKTKQLILPSSEFIQANPQFLNKDFRDLSAYKRANHRRII